MLKNFFLTLVLALLILTIWVIRIWIPNRFSHSHFYNEELAKERKALYEEIVSECLKGKFNIAHYNVVCGYNYTTELEEWVEVYLHSHVDKQKLKEIGDELCTVIDEVIKDNSDPIEIVPCISVHSSMHGVSMEEYYYLRDNSSRMGVVLKEKDLLK